MYKNGLFYGGITLLSLLTHISLLVVVFTRGNYDTIISPIILSSVILVSDVLYFFILKFLKQNTYTLDILLITLLNMSVIFQSCFGGVSFAAKHFIFSILALFCCHGGFRLAQNYRFIEKYKYVFYGICLVIIAAIVLFTGSRGIWIDLGFITLQPSEFLKVFYILVFATSIAQQQKKKKLFIVNIVYDNIILFALTGIIILLQWWCRDLGSLPTFAAVAGCGFLMRICYPKAKLSKKLIIGLSAVGLVIVIIALRFAPSYVQDRLHVDIWSDPTGNGWQQCKALIAIAEGGWFGKGPGQGTLHKVPAADTDIVFSSICEEWGMLMALLAVFMIILLLVTSLINMPRSYFHSTLTVGVCAAFIVQMSLNIFGSCNMIPFTGVTIPFISQGGSSMLTCGFMIGFLKAGQAMVYPVPQRPVQQPPIRQNINRRTV